MKQPVLVNRIVVRLSNVLEQITNNIFLLVVWLHNESTKKKHPPLFLFRTLYNIFQQINRIK